MVSFRFSREKMFAKAEYGEGGAKAERLH